MQRIALTVKDALNSFEILNSKDRVVMKSMIGHLHQWLMDQVGQFLTQQSSQLIASSSTRAGSTARLASTENNKSALSFESKPQHKSRQALSTQTS